MSDIDLQKTNPFEVEKYKNLQGIPDEPLAVGSDIVEKMISNEEVPDYIKDKYWYVFTRDNVLGFLDEERKKQKMLSFDILKLDGLASMPRKKYTFKHEQELNMMRNVFETKLDRSVGIQNNNTINERKAIISNVSESRQITESDDSIMKDGFIKKLFGGRNRR